MVFVKVANVDEIEESRGKQVNVNGTEIALIKFKGKIYALENTCPHAGGPLAEGFVEEDVVVCSWHGYQFNLASGVSPMSPGIKVRRFEVKVDGGEVKVEV